MSLSLERAPYNEDRANADNFRAPPLTSTVTRRGSQRNAAHKHRHDRCPDDDDVPRLPTTANRRPGPSAKRLDERACERATAEPV